MFDEIVVKYCSSRCIQTSPYLFLYIFDHKNKVCPEGEGSYIHVPSRNLFLHLTWNVQTNHVR